MDELIHDVTMDQFAWYCLEFVRERGVRLAMKLPVACEADVASLFARDTCWHMGRKLLHRWICLYTLDQTEMSNWNSTLYWTPSSPQHPTEIDHFCTHRILSRAHLFPPPPLFHPDILPLHNCNCFKPDPALILFLFKTFSLLSWTVFHYPWPSLVDSISAIYFSPLWIRGKKCQEKAVLNKSCQFSDSFDFCAVIQTEKLHSAQVQNLST